MGDHVYLSTFLVWSYPIQHVVVGQHAVRCGRQYVAFQCATSKQELLLRISEVPQQ